MRLRLTSSHSQRRFALLLAVAGVTALVVAAGIYSTNQSSSSCGELIVRNARLNCVAQQERQLDLATLEEQLLILGGMGLIALGVGMALEIRPRLVSVAQAAELAGVRPARVRRLIDDGTLPSHKGRDQFETLVDPDELLRQA